MVASLKAEIKHELQVEEIRQVLEQQSGRLEFELLSDEVADTAQAFKSSIEQLPEAEKRAKQHE